MHPHPDGQLASLRPHQLARLSSHSRTPAALALPPSTSSGTLPTPTQPHARHLTPSSSITTPSSIITITHLQGITTLLGQGPLGLLTHQEATPSGPHLLRAPRHCPGLAKRALLRELSGQAPPLAGLELLAKRMRHQRTFRGHKLAVYCLAFDRSGRKIVTGEGGSTGCLAGATACWQ